MMATTNNPQKNYGRDDFLLDENLSCENLMVFDRYAALLSSWQSRMNLVAASTLPQLWHRHFLDSAQLYPLLPTTAHTLIDIGSGAGFPALVLALLMQIRGRSADIHLYESVGKKAAFLQQVATDLALPVTIHACRAESTPAIAADIITARAVAPLGALLPLTQPFLKPHTRLLLLKGEKAEAEVADVRNLWYFRCTMTPSRTDPRGRILIIDQLRYSGHNRKRVKIKGGARHAQPRRR